MKTFVYTVVALEIVSVICSIIAWHKSDQQRGSVLNVVAATALAAWGITLLI